MIHVWDKMPNQTQTGWNAVSNSFIHYISNIRVIYSTPVKKTIVQLHIYLFIWNTYLFIIFVQSMTCMFTLKMSLFHGCFSNILLVKTNYLVSTETLVENGLRLMNSTFKALIFSTDLINKNIFRVSNYEFGSKFNVRIF